MPYSEKVKSAIEDIPTLNQIEIEAKAKEILKSQQINQYEVIISDTEEEEVTNKINRVYVNIKRNVKLALSQIFEMTELQISNALIYGKKAVKGLIDKGTNLIHFNSENIDKDLEDRFKKAEETQNPFHIMKVMYHPNFVSLVGMILTCVEEGIPFTLNSGIVIMAFYVACLFSKKVKNYAISKKQEE